MIATRTITRVFPGHSLPAFVSIFLLATLWASVAIAQHSTEFDQISGTTISLPSVTTAAPSSVTTGSAVLGGNVTDDGGAPVTERGVVYDTAPDPTTDDNVFPIGDGTGSFSQTVEDLDHGTLYYVRAYAINSEGTAYGSQQAFTTQVNVESILRHDPPSELTNAEQVVFQVNFSAEVAGLSSSNFQVTSSGISGAAWAGISGSASSYLVFVNTGTGNGTLGLTLSNSTGVTPTISSLPFSDEIYTIDKTPPSVTISSVEASPTNASLIPVDIDFSKDVTGFSVGDVTVSGGTPSNFSGSGANYSVEITPSGDGTITVDAAAGVAQDAAGNDNTAASQFSIVSDRTEPDVVITADDANEFNGELYTNADVIPVTITYSKPVWGFGGSDINVSNATWSDFDGADGDTEFSVNINPPPGSGPEVITVEVDAGVAEDEAGNENTAASPLQFTWDQNRPAPAISTTAGNLTNESPIPIVVDFGKPVQSFTSAMAEDAVSSDGGATFSIQNLSSDDDEVFTFDLAPDANDMFTIELAEGVVLDLAGNPSFASNAVNVTFDGEQPEISFHAVEDGGAFSDDPIESPTNLDAFTLYISFSKPVIGFAEGMLNESNATLSDFTEVDVSDGLYSVRVEAVLDGEISITIAEGVVQDESGNDNLEGAFAIESDRTAPEVVALDATIDPTPINPGFTNVSSFELQLQFSKPVVDFDVGGLNVDNGSVSLLDEDNQQTFTLGVTADNVTDSAHTVSVEVPVGAFSDEAGNELSNGDNFTIVFGDIRPTAEFTTTAVNPTDQEPIPVTLTITEIFGHQVSEFDVADIISDNVAQIELADDSNPVFELMITPDGVGPYEITLSLPEGAVSDIAGNENEASGLFTISVAGGIDPLPVPVSSPLGLLILAVLMLMMGLRRKTVQSH
jgi:hypothetical protein